MRNYFIQTVIQQIILKQIGIISLKRLCSSELFGRKGFTLYIYHTITCICKCYCWLLSYSTENPYNKKKTLENCNTDDFGQKEHKKKE